MFADLNGVSHFYEETGDGERLIFIHGLGSSHEFWKKQVPALSQTHRVTTYDGRGSGKTEKPIGAYTIEDLAEDLRALLDHLGEERAIIVGLSMGGGVAQTFALAYPERVTALGLISTSSEFPEKTRARFLAQAERVEREGMAPLVDSMIPRWFAPAFIEANPEQIASSRGLTLANDPRAFAARCRANAARDWAHRLPEITCPVLYVGGALDPADARHNASVFSASIPQLEMHIMDGVSHCLPLEAPDEFNSILQRFLSDLRTDSVA